MIERATLKPHESLSIHAEKLLTEPFMQHLCYHHMVGVQLFTCQTASTRANFFCFTLFLHFSFFTFFYIKFGYLSTEKSDGKKPYAATDVWSQTVRDWEWHVNEVMPAGYLARTYRFRCQREAGTELDFFRLVDSTVALPDIETTLPNTGASGRPQAAASSASSRQ